jgi:gliding motility-associated-like protein
MWAAILTQRPGLLQDECSAPCVENIHAFFLRDTVYTKVGDSVSFSNTSTGASNFTWSVDNVVASSNTNFKYVFSAIGKFKITLKAFNADSNCYSSYSTYVLVNCGVSAKFYNTRRVIASRIPTYPDSIVFVNTSFRGVSYKWLVANDKGLAEHVESTATDLTYTFPVPGNYTIRLIATNGSCIDTSGTQTISVMDPDADASIYLFNAYCFQQTKIKISFCITNFGYTPLPKNTPVNFYDADPRLPGAKKLSPTFYLPFQAQGICSYCFYDQTLDVPYAGLNQVYAVVNDSGNTSPLLLPNTSLTEKNYFNNVTLISNIKFRVVATPATATLLPGDTLQLRAQANPAGFPSATYKWSDAYKLSCTACANPQLYADSDRIKRVIATSQFGCIDTTFLTIKVPPANDYTVNINSVCPVKDSMTVNFTLFNQFFRGVIPKKLVVAFYNSDPRAAGATLLPPVFSVADTSFTLQKTFNTKIKIMPAGNLYAVVNDSAIAIPISLPNTPKLEKIYTNNIHTIPFAPNKTSYDIAICKGQNYFGYSTDGTYTDTLPNFNGCDSIRTVKLTVKPVFTTSVTTAICFGENYAGHTTSGTFVDVYPAINGCDSTRTLFLTVKPLSFSNISAIICQGENYAGHTSTGMYVDVYAAANGCDSTRTLTLTVNPTKALRVDTSICEGETYFAGGKLQTKAGTYYDTARTYLNCDSIKTTNLVVHPLPKPNLGTDRGICKDDTYTMNPGNFVSYRWQDGSTNATYTTNILGQYFVAVKTIFGCTFSDTIVLNSVLPLPSNFLPPDSFLCLGNILRVAVPGYKTYLWSNGSNTSFTDLTNTGNYRLQVTDQFDCKGSDVMKVVFYTDCIIIGIPSAFSPNGDGRNETFKPLIPAPVTNYRMQIFNRPGQLLFETDNPITGWDGKYKGVAQAPAAFVYYITLKNYKGEIEKHKGTMVLVR